MKHINYDECAENEHQTKIHSTNQNLNQIFNMEILDATFRVNKQINTVAREQFKPQSVTKSSTKLRECPIKECDVIMKDGETLPAFLSGHLRTNHKYRDQ